MSEATYRGWDALPPDLPPLAVAIGVFDGVHRGHQALLRRAAEVAREIDARPAALTFDPHPAAVFAPERVPPLLAPLPVRLRLLHEHGASVVVVADFDRLLSQLSPDAFVREILVERLHARAVVVGDDFRYGKGRAGDVASLRADGARYGFRVEVIPPVLIDCVPARSTIVRERVVTGAVEEAARLLGRPYTVWGEVVEGRKLGRTIGYPTANLHLAPEVAVPALGVYAGRAYVRGQWHRAAVSVGTNPTVVANGARTVEAFLMDGFTDDIYGEEVALQFLAYIRPEAKFPSLDALVAQMGHDVAEIARRVGTPHPSPLPSEG